MRKSLALLSLAALAAPLFVSALDYSNAPSQYKDARSFSTAETAAISVLSNAGVLQGNPDGSFRARRTLNRAEFTKIAMEVWKISEDMPISDTQWKTDCFPDVRGEVWYADPVCRAKDLGLVRGNPDGLFHPEREVNYAEAVKILVTLFEYELSNTRGVWYVPYIDAAIEHDVTFSADVSPGHALTRGEMTRLTAAFLAESQGEIEMYRAAERGESVTSSSSSSATSSTSSSSFSSTSSISSIPSSSSSSTTSSPASHLPDLPVRSHFLMLGTRSEPIAALTFFADKEPMDVRSIKVVLARKILSIDAMFLVDENGTELGQFSLDHLYDSSDKTWRGSFPVAGAYTIPKGEQRILGVEVRLKERGKGGSSDELVEVEDMELSAQGQWSGATYTAISGDIVFPKHQTAQARVTSVKNALEDTGSLPLGSTQLIGAFTFEGTHVAEADLALNTVEFQLSKANGVNTSNFQIGTGDSPALWPCTVSELTVSCSSIPAEIGTLTAGPRTLRLFANVSLDSGTQNPFLQVSINQPGSVGVIGAVHWTDGSGDFTWTELGAPIVRGTRFQ